MSVMDYCISALVSVNWYIEGEKPMLAIDFEYYTAHQSEIVDGHLGEFVVIKDARVLGYYKEEMAAFASMKLEVPGAFMVKKCKPKGEDIETYLNSQVVFA
jgi:hypothetical protein